MKYPLICFLIIITFSTRSFSQSTHSSEIGIQVDNDSFLAQYSDRYYTNGTFLYFRHALDASSNNLLENKVLGIEAGQKLFNAQSGYVADQRYIDRPFAGYLYAGANLNLLYKNESSVKLGAQIGVVGPSSQGEEVQNFIHNVFGFYQLNGWQYQVGNDLELNLSAEYNKLIARASLIDATLSTYLNVGNGLTGAGIGPLIRIGHFNQLFRSVSTQSTAIKGNSSTALHKNELFFYYKPQINLVIYDATVQGSVFKKYDPNSLAITLDPTPVVFSQQVGVAYACKRLIMNAGIIFHNTRDVKEMVKPDQWGSISMFYRFN